MNRFLKPSYLYSTFVNCLMMVPCGIRITNRHRMMNIPTAKNAVRIMKSLGYTPKMLYDIGAANSEWAYWLCKAWPKMKVYAFEPRAECRPMCNSSYRVALSNYNGRARLVNKNQVTEIERDINGDIDVITFDSIIPKLVPNSIVKIDCEQSTYAALEGGCGAFKDADFIVIEMADNTCPFGGDAWKIWKLMTEMGFLKHSITGFVWNNGHATMYDVMFWK